MNWDRIYNSIRPSAAPGSREKQVLDRIKAHRKMLARARKARIVHKPSNIEETPQWRLIRHALQNNHRIIAFDAEWQRYYPYAITELGIAAYHMGSIETHNVRIRGGAGKVVSPTRFMHPDKAREWLSRMFRSADLIVGHALNNDRSKLAQWGITMRVNIPVLDTARWSKALNPVSRNEINLSKFCLLNGLETHKAHVAANDALMTLNLAIKLSGLTAAN